MASRTSLFVQRQVGGMFAVEDMAATTGNRFFVDSGSATNGTTSGFGKSPDKPFSSIEACNNASVLTANNGDLVIIMPGHAETVSAAAGLDCDIAGVTYRGIGDGASQPTITLDTVAGADVDVDAANITFENLHFVAGVADITAMIDVNADDFTIRNCRFSQSAVDLNALICIQDASAGTSDRITIDGCHAIMYDASNTHFVNFAGTGTGHVVKNNVLIGDWGTMCIGGAGIITYCTIMDNVIYNAATTNDSCINLNASVSGVMVRNLAGGGAAQANGFVGDGVLKAENYYSDLSDASAILDPVAT